MLLIWPLFFRLDGLRWQSSMCENIVDIVIFFSPLHYDAYSSSLVFKLCGNIDLLSILAKLQGKCEG
jgi:hypothetical protein